LKVRETMTAPALTCTPTTSLAVAARVMQEADYGTLPVVDSGGRLVGIITDRDICLAVAGSNRNAISITVHEAMTHKVFSALLDDDVHSALATMKASRVRRLPVCDDSGHLEGILSIEDLVVRGLEGGGINTDELVAALRAMYVRAPVAANSAQMDGEFTPG
jgi:CBS domain-containing protein